MPRIVILTEGKSSPDEAKTATGVLRYRQDEVVALLDSSQAGRRAADVLGVGGDIPFVASLDETRGDTLVIGIAPAGGELPETWRAIVRSAIVRGMNVVSGLHSFLNDDPELAELARRHGVRLEDVRSPPAETGVAEDRARRLGCHRVHTVGHDCSVGKMVAALEITRGLTAAGRRAEFVATGQTGILLAGKGVAVDHVVSDFVAGAIERELVTRADREFLVVEGQGSLAHPLYSGVTLGLLHGCAPQTLVLVFHPARTHAIGTDLPLPSLGRFVALYEELASILTPSKVVAVAANTAGMGAGAAEALVRRTENELGLPTADVVRHGPGRVVEAILARHAALGLETLPGAETER